MGTGASGAPSLFSASMRAIFGALLLAVPAMASASEIQRLDRMLVTEVAFHEKAPPKDMSQGQVHHVSSEDMRLITEVGRIVVDSGDAGQFADEITVQFAVQPPDQPPSNILTIAMAHVGEGSYSVADEPSDAMGDWFVEHNIALLKGNAVLLRVDGLPASQADAAVRFEIEGECTICQYMR